MNENTPMPKQTSRREFLKTSTTAVVTGALAANVLSPRRAFAVNSETMKVGLIGCGGRGNGAASDALTSDSNSVLYAMADIFPNKIEVGLGEIRNSIKDDTRIDVPPERRFVGL